ncbi:MAG: Kup system potassium uptake protein [Myxococcales bacterium]|nr:Kup system potassium uptake protein [Myxococcales bacterium]
MTRGAPVSSAEGHAPSGRLSTLTLAALGIVFGDIGTSPLYTLRECTTGEHGAAPTPENLLGVLSLIFWALMMVVGVKYLSFIMKAHNRGEGGICALLALVPPSRRSNVRSTHVGIVAVLVLAGAALLYGDGIVTPAISVLSAVEGLETTTASLHAWIVPITCVILVGLFAIQSRGTASVGRLFGPVMLVWFVTLGILGVRSIALHPAVLQALSPHHAIGFFARNGVAGAAVLGGVVLAVTGGEALYADMGHFGARPIRLGWWLVAMPALVLNYLGQGALILREPSALANPFYALVAPGWPTYALVILATLATIIASQALISGAFSLTHQAVQLGYFPRVTVLHTSHEAEGQIYIPQINWALMLACVALVLGFQKSSHLAAAYGIAVTGTMGITSIVYYVVARETWGWSRAKALPLLVLFLSFDLPFFGANLIKVEDGGYVPLLVGAAMFFVMITWKQGRALLHRRASENAPSIETFVAADHGVLRSPGVGVFLASSVDHVPPSLAFQASHMHVLPEHVVLFTLVLERQPNVPRASRVEASDLGRGFYRVIGHIGFMDRSIIPLMVETGLAHLGINIPPSELTYYAGRETLLATKAGDMGAIRETVFAFLLRNAEPATSHFHIPPGQVIEMGMQYDL